MSPLQALEAADLLLASIALSILAALAAVLATSISARIAMAAAAVPASGTMWYALFYSPPEST